METKLGLRTGRSVTLSSTMVLRIYPHYLATLVCSSMSHNEKQQLSKTDINVIYYYIVTSTLI